MTSIRSDWLKISVVVAIGSLGACSKPPPPPPPPPPPVAEAVPYRPLPPQGAAYVMDLPPVGADGQRITINSNLDANSTLWHFRSAWNVAALNCLDAGHEPILDAYGRFLKDGSRQLAAANTALDAKYRQDQGARTAGIRAREAYMTQVYNYFALPPARERFCTAAFNMSNQYLTLSPAPDAREFAAANLPTFEAIYQDFFRDYEQYQRASAEWDSRWGAQYGASQPGYVAVHGASGQSVGSALVNTNLPTPASTVVDPETGEQVPVVPVDTTPATPVVQPVPSGQ